MITMEQMKPHLPRLVQDELTRWGTAFEVSFELEKEEEEKEKDGQFIFNTKKIKEERLPYKYTIDSWHLSFTFLANTKHPNQKDVIFQVKQHIHYATGTQGLKEIEVKGVRFGELDYDQVENPHTSKSLGIYCRDLDAS